MIRQQYVVKVVEHIFSLSILIVFLHCTYTMVMVSTLLVTLELRLSFSVHSTCFHSEVLLSRLVTDFHFICDFSRLVNKNKRNHSFSHLVNSTKNWKWLIQIYMLYAPYNRQTQIVLQCSWIIFTCYCSLLVIHMFNFLIHKSTRYHSVE